MTHNNLSRVSQLYSFSKLLANSQEISVGDFLHLEDGFLYYADGTRPIEGVSQDAISSPIDNETTQRVVCTYIPIKRWDVYNIEVVNGTLTQADVGSVFSLNASQQIDYTTKKPIDTWPGEWRLEEIASQDGKTNNDSPSNFWRFTYNFTLSFSAKGNDGIPGTAATVDVDTTVSEGPVNVVNVGTNTNAIFRFTIPKGLDGAPGTPWGPGPKGNDGDSATITWVTAHGLPPGSAPTVTMWGTPMARTLDFWIAPWADGVNGKSWIIRGPWNSATPYNTNDVVRYADTDGIPATRGRTWPDGTINAQPWIDGRRVQLVKDGAKGAPGAEGGTIVIPVEGKPGRDGGPGAPGTNGQDGKAMDPQGDWDSGVYYPALSSVRAKTWDVDAYGDDIRAYYITKTWASAGSDPKDGGPWELVSKDGYPGPWTTEVCTIAPGANTVHTFTYDTNGNEPNASKAVGNYSLGTGNRALARTTGITIQKDGHYRVKGSVIIQMNTWGVLPYCNLVRTLLQVSSWRYSVNPLLFMGTSKDGGPYAPTQGPWVTQFIDFHLDLYAGDVLTLFTRGQSDSWDAIGKSGQYTVIGVGDFSTDIGLALLGGTNLSVCMISPVLFQAEDNRKYYYNI